ncbi:MAG: hypothetical protein WHT45_02255 [Ignavibacterium sp.]
MKRQYYRKKYYSTYYDSHTYTSYSDETKSYIRKEFFSVNKTTFIQIAELYRSLYGEKPYSYLLEAYNLWKKGERRVSDQTMERILKCVPKYLSKEKKIFILKSEIIQFIGRQQKKYENKPINCNQIDDIYKEFFNSIEDFDYKDLRWFVKDVFTKKEIDKYIEISKYVVKKKLEQSYHQVKSDLKILYPIISQISFGVVAKYYTIDFFKTKLDLNTFPEINLKLRQREIPEPSLDENIDERMLSYLVEEILKLTYIQELGKINHKISKSDLSILWKQYKDFLDNDNEANIFSEFQGKGGIFSIKIVLKSKSKLSQELVLSVSKSIAYLLGFALELYLFIKFNLFSKSSILVIIFIIVSIYLLIQVYFEYVKSKSLRLEVIKYGRRQRQ